MSTVPVRGRAVQAPIVSVPSSVPRVVVIHVEPTPTAAARPNATSATNKTLTVQFLRGAAASPGLAAAKLSGKASEPDWTGLPGFGGSVADVLSAVLAASSSIFSIRTRRSAPRLVSTGGGPGLISGAFGATVTTAPLAAIV